MKKYTILTLSALATTAFAASYPTTSTTINGGGSDYLNVDATTHTFVSTNTGASKFLVNANSSTPQYKGLSGGDLNLTFSTVGKIGKHITYTWIDTYTDFEVTNKVNVSTNLSKEIMDANVGSDGYNDPFQYLVAAQSVIHNQSTLTFTDFNCNPTYRNSYQNVFIGDKSADGKKISTVNLTTSTGYGEAAFVIKRVKLHFTQTAVIDMIHTYQDAILDLGGNMTVEQFYFRAPENNISGSINLNGKNLTIQQAIYNPGEGKTSNVCINFADGAETFLIQSLGLSTNSTNLLSISGFNASEDFLLVGKSGTDYSDRIFFADLGTKGVDYEIVKGEETINNVKYTSYSYKLAIPEPSTYAMIFGAIALGFVAYRRKK